MKTPTVGAQIVASGIDAASHDSVRRAIKKILKRSSGRVPKEDLRAILKIVAMVL